MTVRIATQLLSTAVAGDSIMPEQKYNTAAKVTDYATLHSSNQQPKYLHFICYTLSEWLDTRKQNDKLE